MGQTVIDWWGATDRPKNVHVVREVDDDAFFALLVERIAGSDREQGHGEMPIDARRRSW